MTDTFDPPTAPDGPRTPAGLRSQLFIDGTWRPARSGATLRVHEPATGRHLADVAAAGPDDVDEAVRVARRTYDEVWSRTEPADRARVLRRIAELIDARADELARLETLDGGKPIAETLPRVRGAAAWFQFYADMACTLRTAVLPTPSSVLTYSLRRPIGVVGAIIPWNYPISSCAVKLPAALAMGNTVVLKPAEDAPLLPLALAELCQEAGLPDGAVNVVPGVGDVAGRAIVDHPGVGIVTFTGSTRVGREIAVATARRLVPVVLELGGKSPNIVFEDADLDVAAATSLFTFAQNQGQICTAGTRLLVQESIHDDFVERVRARAEALRIGDPLDPATQLGAVINERQLHRVEGYVADGRRGGATLVTGGARPTVAGCEDGTFYMPTIFTDVDPGAPIAREEIFGPVLSVLPFRDEADAIRLANDTLYGLAAAVWTRDVARAHRLAEAVEAGVVWVNTMHVLGPGAPLGGWKESGLGVMGGEEQAHSFTRLKSVWVNLTDSAPAFGA